MKIGIIIVNYNGNHDTQECLESISKLKTKYELIVIVVDNNSKENLKLKTSDLPYTLECLKNKENVGFAAGNNVGIRRALESGCDYVCVLNNDTLVDPDFLDELVNTYKKNTRAGLVSPKIYFSKGREFHKDKYEKNELGKVIWYAGGEMDWDNILGKHRGVDEVDKGQFSKDMLTDFATGCSFLVSRDVLDAVGFFDETYFLYYEDADFSEKVKRAGYHIWYSSKSVIWHKNAGSTGGSGSALQDYYITRNRLLFALRYASFRSRMSVFRESLRLIFNGRPWQKKGVLDFYLMKFGKGSYVKN